MFGTFIINLSKLDLDSPNVKKCSGISDNLYVSDCLDNKTILECPTANTFRNNIYWYLECAPDLVCEKRGLRSYCVDPTAEESEIVGCASNVKSTCDPINMRKQIDCVTGNQTLCSTSTVCSPISKTETACVPWSEDLLRFCSNKPLFSSFCIAGDPDLQFVMCGQTPSIMRCPLGSKKCFQNLSISAQCTS